MRRRQKIVLTTAAVFFLVLFAAAIILPKILRDQVIEQVRSNYGRELSIEHIAINPLTLRGDIRKLDLKEPGSA